MAKGGALIGLAALGGGLLLLFSGKKAKAAGGGGQNAGTGKYPWKQFSQDTKALQNEINQWLSDGGFQTITADGVLGGETCGAAEFLRLEGGPGAGAVIVPNTCKEFTWVPTAVGGKTYGQWDAEIESIKNNAAASMNIPAAWSAAAVKLDSLNPPFPTLEVKATTYAQQFRDMVSAYNTQALQYGGG